MIIVLDTNTVVQQIDPDGGDSVVLVDLDKDHALLNDPAYAEERRQVQYDDFMLAWSDMDLLYTLISR